jgi:ElaB/YqjD/DUF883 family membrane-anchored ribosome-binding protein
MERTTPLGGSATGSSNLTNPIKSTLDDATQAAHKTTDKFAEKATAQVDRSAETVHRAVDGAAGVATTAAEWTTANLERAKKTQAQLTDAASASIRGRPIATVAGALVVGYLIGRLARL